MEQKLTMQELIALINDEEGEFIVHVNGGEEDADEKESESGK